MRGIIFRKLNIIVDIYEKHITMVKQKSNNYFLELF